MSRINAALFLCLILLAIAVVHTQHRTRRLFIDLQKEKDHTEQQIAEWHQLQIEQGLLTSSHRVEEGAISGLQMQLPKEAQSRLVVLGTSPTQVAHTPLPEVPAPAHGLLTLAAVGSGSGAAAGPGVRGDR